MNDQFTGKVLANKYQIDSVLREDELGKAYLATHLSMEKPVTVKILSPALAVDENIVRRFASEAKTASRISHPNILNVIDTDNKNYIVFEGTDGVSLKDAIRTSGKFSSERAVNIARQVSSALSAAHAADTIHGNLTSENIFLNQAANHAEMVKVFDIGAVKSDITNNLDEEISLGKFEYLSPEQCSDAGNTDARSDIYSLGVILYEMLAGEVPFAGATATELMLKHSQEPPPPLSAFRQDLPADIEPVILHAMAKNPEMRYQSIDEFSNDLSRISKSFTETGAVVIPRTATATDNSSNNIWKTAFVVLAGISLLAIGLIYATSTKQTDPTTALQTDANGQPVQPINPATGADELNLSNMASMPAEIVGNSNMSLPPGTMPGGDGYNPWANGVQPPPGAPPYIPSQTGPVITIDPNNPNSVFMQGENGVILVPIPPNTNTNVAVKPSPTPKTTNANANVSATPVPNATPKTTATPSTETPKTTATPKVEKPAPKPTEPAKKTPPTSTEKRSESGKNQDAF